jgi:hypothetical protein
LCRSASTPLITWLVLLPYMRSARRASSTCGRDRGGARGAARREESAVQAKPLRGAAAARAARRGRRRAAQTRAASPTHQLGRLGLQHAPPLARLGRHQLFYSIATVVHLCAAPGRRGPAIAVRRVEQVTRLASRLSLGGAMRKCRRAGKDG